MSHTIIDLIGARAWVTGGEPVYALITEGGANNMTTFKRLSNGRSMEVRARHTSVDLLGTHAQIIAAVAKTWAGSIDSGSLVFADKRPDTGAKLVELVDGLLHEALLCARVQAGQVPAGGAIRAAIASSQPLVWLAHDWREQLTAGERERLSVDLELEVIVRALAQRSRTKGDPPVRRALSAELSVDAERARRRALGELVGRDGRNGRSRITTAGLFDLIRHHHPARFIEPGAAAAVFELDRLVVRIAADAIPRVRPWPSDAVDVALVAEAASPLEPVRKSSWRVAGSGVIRWHDQSTCDCSSLSSAYADAMLGGERFWVGERGVEFRADALGRWLGQWSSARREAYSVHSLREQIGAELVLQLRAPASAAARVRQALAAIAADGELERLHGECVTLSAALEPAADTAGVFAEFDMASSRMCELGLRLVHALRDEQDAEFRYALRVAGGAQARDSQPAGRQALRRQVELTL